MKLTLKNIFKTFIYFFIILIGIQLNVYSQTKHDLEQIEQLKLKLSESFFGISFTNMVPQKQFMDNYHKTGQGFLLNGGICLPPAPIAIGFEAGAIFNGSAESIREHSWIDPFDHEVYFYDTLSTQSVIIPINIFFRIEPSLKGLFIPYVQVFAGMNLFYLSVDDKNGDYKNENSKGDVAFSYGANVGAMFKLAQFITPSFKNAEGIIKESSKVDMMLDVNFRYVNSGNSEYWYADIDNFRNLNLRNFKSKTDHVLFNLGLTFRF